MVENAETASILNNLIPRFEVWYWWEWNRTRKLRLTPGVLLAWSSLEYFHNHPTFKARLFFATHYHWVESTCRCFSKDQKLQCVGKKEVGDKVDFYEEIWSQEEANTVFEFMWHKWPDAESNLCCEQPKYEHIWSRINLWKKERKTWSQSLNNYQAEACLKLTRSFKEAKENDRKSIINSIFNHRSFT